MKDELAKNQDFILHAKRSAVILDLKMGWGL
jgi:hypothetical protein